MKLESPQHDRNRTAGGGRGGAESRNKTPFINSPFLLLLWKHLANKAEYLSLMLNNTELCLQEVWVG